MGKRQTLNVSLPESQEQFVRNQVDSGRYRTASEVVRDGLRLLEESEQRRLLEKWLTQDLTPEELAHVPEEALAKTKSYFHSLIEEAKIDFEAGRMKDGHQAMRQLRDEIVGLHK